MSPIMQMLYMPIPYVDGFADIPGAVIEFIGIDSGYLLIGQIGGYGGATSNIEDAETQPSYVGDISHGSFTPSTFFGS